MGWTPCSPTYSAWNGGDALKPGPTMALAALAKHGLDATETLLIGRYSELDIQAGRVAGVRTCLFGRAHLSRRADLRIDDYAQLLTRLREAVSNGPFT